MSFSILNTILIILALALATTLILRRWQIPVVIGYVLSGAIIGPYGMGWLNDYNFIYQIAEFGVVFLMFTIGLNFSFARLKKLKASMLILGGSQVFITILVVYLIGLAVGMSAEQSFIVGAIAAMSSTALVLKQLKEQNELAWPHGQNTTGVLLFQDVAVIPIIVLIAGFSGSGEHSIWFDVISGSLKGVLGIVIIYFLGTWILRPLFHLVIGTRIAELLTLLVLLITIGCATLTHNFGVSYALGAFMAGMMLSESGYRHAIEVEIRPFRDVLLGLFFISIGMLIDVSTWSESWPWILLLLTALIFGKLTLILLLCLRSQHNIVSSTRTALCLAHGGEFGFAILTLAMHNQLLPLDYSQAILSALLLSMMIAPVMISYNERIATWLLPSKLQQRYRHGAIEDLHDQAFKRAVMILGYGRVGQQVANVLREVAVDYTAFDFNPNVVRKANIQAEEVLFANVTHPDIIKMLGDNSIKAVIVCLAETDDSINVIQQLRAQNPHVFILARCNNNNERQMFTDAGAQVVIPETLDSSLMLAYHLLTVLLKAGNDVGDILSILEAKRYELIHYISKL